MIDVPLDLELTPTSATTIDLEADGPLVLNGGEQRAPRVGDRWECALIGDAAAVFTITAVGARPEGKPGWRASAETDANGANLLAARLRQALGGDTC